jgi:hypothetical protein
MTSTILAFAVVALIQSAPMNLKLDLAKARKVFTKECKPLLEPWVGGKLPIGNGVVLFSSKKTKRGSKFVSITILLDGKEPTSYEKKCIFRWAGSLFGIDGLKPITKHLVLTKYVDQGKYGDKVRGLFFYTKKYIFQGMKQLKIMVFKF